MRFLISTIAFEEFYLKTEADFSAPLKQIINEHFLPFFLTHFPQLLLEVIIFDA